MLEVNKIYCGDCLEVMKEIDDKSGDHPATFPEKLAEDHVLSWSNEGDLILDPFSGSGTTLKMGKKNKRNYVGIEISKEYCELIEKRLAAEVLPLLDNNLA